MANSEAMTKDVANLSKADFFLHFLNMTIIESNSLGRSDAFTPKSFLEDHLLDLGDDSMQRVVQIANHLVDWENDESEQWVDEVTHEMQLIGCQLREAGEAFLKISSMFGHFSRQHGSFARPD